MKFKHHKYTWTTRGTSDHHSWSLLAHDGGMQFNVFLMHDQEKYPEPSCGLEFHSFNGSGPPDHINCPITGGRCWHDGTSLYASETVWPMVKLMMPDHKRVFDYLEGIAHDHWRRDEP